MNFSIWTSYLGKALDHAIIGFLPASGDDYSLVSLRFADSYMTVFASAPEISVSAKFPATCEASDTDIVVYARLLQSICKQARGETMQFSLDVESGMLHIESGNAQWKIKTSTKSLTLIDDQNNVDSEIDAEKLGDALREVSYAVGYDTGRSYLSMVNIREGKAQACDGLKYHEVVTGVDGLNLSVRSTLIKPLIAWLAHYNQENMVKISETGSVDHFRIDQPNYSVTVTALKTTSTFPDLDSIMIRAIKSQVPSLLQVGKTDLLSGLRQVKVLSEKDSPVVELSLEGESTLLRCFKRNGTEATSRVPSKWSASNRVATFDVNALLDLISAFDEELLELRFGKDTRERQSPVALSSTNSWAMLNQIKVLNKR